MEDNRRWESGMRVNIPNFDRDTFNPEGFIDWLIAVEEIFEFKEVPENKRVSLIDTKLRGRASAWWQQMKLTRERVGKSKITSWYQESKFLIKMPPRRSEGEELEYPFFEGDGSSSDEWGDYGVACDDYEGASVFDDDYKKAPVFDDDQFKEESTSVYDTDIEDIIKEEDDEFIN
uniref:Reverse transcriptase domain-containing protein n=1 Tax=Tanacetum cinerariifolium TaxID=118510 RepID=A0A6L2MEG6_TANCI|nr:reverse transcriptase domain-containing protein [Tanacetum cinerariifolium]